jgi:hypothetical protein
MCSSNVAIANQPNISGLWGDSASKFGFICLMALTGDLMSVGVDIFYRQEKGV